MLWPGVIGEAEFCNCAPPQPDPCCSTLAWHRWQVHSGPDSQPRAVQRASFEICKAGRALVLLRSKTMQRASFETCKAGRAPVLLRLHAAPTQGCE